jgi:proteasome component ECM29
MGEKAIIFGLLALIRSDPSFGVGSTERLFDQYRVPDIEIEEHKLVKVIPMLYALRFEPNPTVRELMRTLWSKLFRSSTLKAVVNAHLEEIIKYLCSKMCSPIWRDRDSSCLALESLIPQRSWSVLNKYMSELWYNGLRVLDDVRISTRMAALDLMKALSAMVVHCSNPNESEISVVREVVDFIIPMLLDKGLVNPSAEARGFCLGVLLKIVQVNVDSTAPQSSNPLFDRQQAPVRSTPVSQARYRLCEEPLDRWLPPVIAVLVESMSALEPRVLQYMQFHTSRMQLSDEELEQARIKMAQSSPMQEALNCCLKRLTTRMSILE